MTSKMSEIPEDTSNPAKCYDVTLYLPESDEWRDRIVKYVRQNCKHYVFAAQLGDSSEQPHYQCRWSYRKKCRWLAAYKGILLNLFGVRNLYSSSGGKYWSEETKDASKYFHLEQTGGKDTSDPRSEQYYAYCSQSRTLKPDTRVYSDRDIEIDERYFQPIRWYPWQQSVLDMESTDRDVVVIYDPIGGSGKSELAKRMLIQSQAVYLPAVMDAKDLIRAVYDRYRDGQLRKTVVIDIQRALTNSELRKLIIAIEAIKNGVISEDRYEFKQVIIPQQKVIVMCNSVPNPKWLTPDRWKFYRISAPVNGELILANMAEVYAEQVAASKSARKSTVVA